MQEQKKFKYIYNGKEVDRKQFEELAGDNFKWFEGSSIISVPFSSFDSFFDGKFKNKRQINDHLNSVLDVYKNKVTEDIINKSKCSPQCYCDGSCKKPQEKKLGGYNKPIIKGSSTRHKSQAGETHAENKVFFIPPNFTGWFFDNEDRPDIKSFNTIKDAENYFHKSKNTIGRIFKDKEIVKELKKEDKDDVITSSNRGEKEAMEYLQGVKESEGKLNYELDWDFIQQMAERMGQNKGKYKPYNWTKPMDVEKLKQSLFRHVIEVMKSNYSDDGRDFGHFESIALNAMMINYQLKTNG